MVKLRISGIAKGNRSECFIVESGRWISWLKTGY